MRQARPVHALVTAAALTAAICAGGCRAPRVTAIDPPSVAARQTGYVRVQGVRFHAPLDVAIGGAAPRPLFIARPTLGEVEVDALAPGRYDVTVYERGREVFRLARGLAVEQPVIDDSSQPGPAVEIVGAFVRLTGSVSDRLDTSVGRAGPRGVTVVKLGPVRTLRGSGRDLRIARLAVVRIPLDGSCAGVPFARLADVPTPLVVKEDGSQLPRCFDPARDHGFGEIRLERNCVVTLATSVGAVTLVVDALRPSDAAPGFLPRDRARLLATLSDDDARVAPMPDTGVSLYLTPTRRLGTVVSRSRTTSGTARLVIDLRCTPSDQACTLAPTETQPAVALRIGTTLPVLVADRFLRLRIESIHAVDEPLLDEGRMAPDVTAR